MFLLGSRWAAGEATAFTPAGRRRDVARDERGARRHRVFLHRHAGADAASRAATAVVGEVARIRSLLYYVVAGGASAALMPLIAVHPQGAETYSSYAAPYFTLMATAGFAGGIVYWLVAGRNA